MRVVVQISISTWFVRGYMLSLVMKSLHAGGPQVYGVEHSYLPNDRGFGCVETARRRHQHIFVPDDLYNLVERARHTNLFIIIVVMTCTDFISVHY